jgi:transposase
MTTFNFFQYQCFIHFRTQNTNCDDCGLHLFVPKWGRQQSGFTMLFEAFILTLEREIPISKIAEIVDEQHFVYHLSFW